MRFVVKLYILAVISGFTGLHNPKKERKPTKLPDC